jgi:Transcriptional regulator, AbiEi antitoxin, Type IV TA system/Transcriptional regulator, AbiEi antitoxin N-terminal domain
MPKNDKLNWLQRSLPEGLIADAAWLEKHGYSRGLRQKYVAHGWLDPVVRGVYRRPPPQLKGEVRKESPSWQTIVISLQKLLGYQYTVGGRTALELQGFAHYLSTGQREIHLYGSGKQPNWVLMLKNEHKFVFHNVERLFESDVSLHNTDNDVFQSSTIEQPWGQWELPITMSSPERAILELLDEVPKRETFHQADSFMEGLQNLSPGRLQVLLAACRSIKVKRLFLWFAERHKHAWLKQLDRKAINLGHGKRMIARGGKLDPMFNITIPESIDAA